VKEVQIGKAANFCSWAKIVALLAV